ncbi:unnamed protein product [Rhizophagus irregularis]|uniref:Uncharacterized protein n=1 Tax=Rhizophagus irregularis TaxID=588596 RepID=A0A915ZNN1_9GLOM|nr:unnamed protein product [Rhizophagus irregularis]
MKISDQNDAMDVDENYPSREEFQELEQKNSALTASLNECSQERDALKITLDKWEDQVKQSEENLRVLYTENQKICNVNNDLKAQLDNLLSLRTENANLRDEQKNNFNEISNLKSQLDDLSSLRTENANLRDEQKNNFNEISNLKAQLNDLSSLRTENANLRDKQKNNSNEISKLKAQLESENEKLKKVQNDYEVENNDLNDQLSSLRKDNKKLRNGQKNDSSEIRNLKAQLSSENERLNKVQTNLKKVTNDYEVMCGEHDKLKVHLENEKLKNKNSKQNNNHSAVYNDNSNLKVQIKEYKKSLSTLRSEKENLTNQLTELDTENKKLKDKISTSSKSPDSNYSAENDKLKDQFKQLEDEFKEKSKNDQLSTDIKVKNGEISNFQNKSNELEEIRLLQKKNEEYVEEIDNLNKSLRRKEKEKQDLIEKNSYLKKEASQYQSALGTMTNYRMDDDDKNHSVRLKKDIEELQNKLKSYVTTLKGDFEIDFKAVNNLMGKILENTSKKI